MSWVIVSMQGEASIGEEIKVPNLYKLLSPSQIVII
jgi:hypothetical protein